MSALYGSTTDERSHVLHGNWRLWKVTLISQLHDLCKSQVIRDLAKRVMRLTVMVVACMLCFALGGASSMQATRPCDR